MQGYPKAGIEGEVLGRRRDYMRRKDSELDSLENCEVLVMNYILIEIWIKC